MYSDLDSKATFDKCGRLVAKLMNLEDSHFAPHNLNFH